jgi:NADH-quinone oxidoreductase subunit G
MSDASNGKAPEQEDDGRVDVTVDGRSVRVPKGTLVWDAATQAGIHVPVYCAHPKMEPVAVCRMCLVHIEKFPKLQPACATQVADGMVVTTQSAPVAKAREGVLEFLLVNHPLDCPVCDRGGECDLQDFAFRYGPPTSRFPITEKVHAAKGVALSKHIELDQERCILCWRCTRYYDEITGEKELVLSERGVHTVIAPFQDHGDLDPTRENNYLRSPFQGNLPEICPVGALTHREYRFESRPWDLQRTKSVCAECSYGCNVNVDSRDFEIKRFASRDNPLVDDMWLCDRGRYSFERWNSPSAEDRVRRPRVGKSEATLDDATAAAATQLSEIRDRDGGGALAVLGSAESTNEELWLLQRIARELLQTGNLDHRLGDGRTVDAAEATLGIAEIEECAAVVVLGDEPEANAPVLTLRLRKAETKHGVTVHRLEHDAGADEVTKLPQGEGLVGVIADETTCAHAAEIAAAIPGRAVKRLTVTRGPNGRGAKDVGMLPTTGPGYATASPAGKAGPAILEAVAAGAIKGLLILNGAALLEGADEGLLMRALAKAEVVVAIESRLSMVSQAATVLIPGHTFYEKMGTVTNLEGRVQRIRPALPAATRVPSETRVLTGLAEKLGAAEFGRGEVLAVHRALAEALPPYAAAGNGGRAVFEAVRA